MCKDLKLKINRYENYNKLKSGTRSKVSKLTNNPVKEGKAKMETVNKIIASLLTKIMKEKFPL